MAAAGLDLGARRAAYARVARSGTDVRLEAASLVALTAEDEGARAAEVASALGPEGASRARLGLAGRDAILRYLHLGPVPDWRLRLLMEMETAELAEKAGESLASDYRTLKIPADIAGPETSNPVLVGLAKEALLLERIGALEAAAVRTRGVLPTSIALFDAYVGLGHVDEGKTIVLLDAAPEGAELAIARSGSLVFARGFQPQSVRPQELAGAVSAAIQFCRTQQKLKALPVDAVRVSGPLARSPELLEALRGALRVEVTAFDPLERVDVSRLDEATRAEIEGRGPELALAIGLALATQHPRCVHLDLTPRPIVARRDFLTRTVPLYAAGAVLAVALAFAGVGAAVAGSRAKERRADLARSFTVLEDRKGAVDGQAAANKRTIEILDGLSRRTRSGASALRLLSRLRQATPRRVTVHEVSLEPQQPNASRGGDAGGVDSTRGEVALRLRGKADNAGGDAIQLLGRFEAALREDPGVASAKISGTPVSEAGALLDFTMVIAMRADARGEP